MTPESLAWKLVRTDEFPLVYARVPDEPDEASTEEFLRSLQDLLDRKDRFCMIVDLTDTQQLSLLVVQRIAAFAKSSGPQLDELCAAMAFAISSRLVRSAMKVVFHRDAPRHPYALVSNLDEAHAYVAPFLSELA